MKITTIIRYVCMVLLVNAAFMFVSAIVSLFNGVDTGFYPLLLSFIITSIVGVFPLIFTPKEKNIVSKEGYTIVIASWILSCVFGMLPYIIWGGDFTLVNAWFESVSGYTTTGSTIVLDVESLPRGILFWRATTNWIGGVGIVLFALVILPSIAKTKMTLSNVEISSVAKDNYRFNTHKLFKVIVFVYCGLTLTETILLMFAGMNWFDALTQSFSTIATGGFSTKNNSIGYWNSIPIESIITVFMILGGTHIGIIYSTIVAKRNNLFKSEVWRYYILGIVLCSLATAWNLWDTHTYNNIFSSLRYSIFQTVSYVTTTGFASVDAAWWPSFAVVVMTFLSIQCAMAGSTSGGIKIDRLILLIKAIKARTLKIQHPNAVIRLKLNGVTQEDSAVNAAILLISFYLLALFVSTLVMTIYNFDLLTAFTASVASLGNVGPGFGEVGNMSNMDFLPIGAKLWLSLMMMFGRLEMFGLIHIFLIKNWK